MDDAGRYTVTNTVDAQNTFGATLHRTYTCVIHQDGGGWRLDSLTGLD